MLQGLLRTKDYQQFQILDEATGELLCQFDGAKRATRALPGDLVTWTGVEVAEILLRAPGRLHLVGTLELAAKVRYGMTSRGIPIYRFTPFSESYPPFFVGCSEKDVSVNRLARIEFADWEAKSTCPRANLIQMFGAAGDLAAEEEALLWHYGPTRYKGVAPDLVPTKDWEAAEDATEHEWCFHIDPPGCRDIDDAVSLVPSPGGGPADAWMLQIHIASVASWLEANPDLARAASAAGQTLYRDGVAVRPMFPPEYSEGAFSLLPGEDRLAITLSIPWKKGTGFTEPGTWHLQRIRVKESHTYETAEKAAWAPLLTDMASDLAGHYCLDPHEWIEQLMLFYNKSAARELCRISTGILRRHRAPEVERLQRLAALGLPAERLAQRAGEYCEIHATDRAHWGLKAAAYCHGSSPIRRWADCINQGHLRQMILIACGRMAPVCYAMTPADWVAQCNARARAAKAYERDVAFARLLLAEDAQKEWEAIVVEEGRVWVPAWGRLQRADGAAGAAGGQAVRIRVFCDATQKNWKRRLVVRVLSPA